VVLKTLQLYFCACCKLGYLSPGIWGWESGAPLLGSSGGPLQGAGELSEVLALGACLN